jgi:carbonic anhydrase
MRSFLAVTLLVFGSQMFAQHAETSVPSPDMALKELLAGNERCRLGKARRPHQSPARVRAVAKAQHPFAAILSCADSRVPPEVVFDQGVGDLFTVRVAGNVATDDLIASLEYAVAHLGPRLIVVMGHERCGAVSAALQGGPPEGHLETLLSRIQPAIAMAKAEKGDTLDLAVRQNVRNVVEQLKSSDPILAAKVKTGDMKIVGAIYDLDTGKVEILR